MSPRGKRKRMVEEEERYERREKMVKLENEVEKKEGDAVEVASDEGDAMEVDSDEEEVAAVAPKGKGIGRRRQGKGRVVVKAVSFRQRLRELLQK